MEKGKFKGVYSEMENVKRNSLIITCRTQSFFGNFRKKRNEPKEEREKQSNQRRNLKKVH